MIKAKKDVFSLLGNFIGNLCSESNLQVMNVESESILLRTMEFFLRYDIEVWLRKEVSFFFFFIHLRADV